MSFFSNISDWISSTITVYWRLLLRYWHSMGPTEYFYVLAGIMVFGYILMKGASRK